jgi:preprotein translocase subunit SecF
MYFLKREPRIDFLGRRGLAGIVSAVLIVIGIVSLGVRGLAFGIDFTGGTLVEVSYEETVEASSVRDLIAKAGFESALVQYFGTSKDILVRLPASAVEDAAQVSSRIMVALRSPYKETLVTSASGDLQQCLS